MTDQKEGRPALECRGGRSTEANQEPPGTRRASARIVTPDHTCVNGDTVSSLLVLTVEEAAEALRVHPNHLYKLMSRPTNPLRAMEYGGRKKLFHGEEVVRFLRSSTTEGTEGEDA